MTTLILSVLGFSATYALAVSSSMVATWLCDLLKNRRARNSNPNHRQP